MRLSCAIAFEPGALLNWLLRGIARSCCILPFSLGWKPAASPMTEIFRVEIRDHRDWLIVDRPIRIPIASTVLDLWRHTTVLGLGKLAPCLHSHLRLTDPECGRDLDLVRGLLGVRTHGVSLRTSHCERTGRSPHISLPIQGILPCFAGAWGACARGEHQKL